MLESALTRFDELPLRLVETASHGSPWHELLSSDVVKQALKTIPDFSGKVISFACSLIDTTKTSEVKNDTGKESHQGTRTETDEPK